MSKPLAMMEVIRPKRAVCLGQKKRPEIEIEIETANANCAPTTMDSHAQDRPEDSTQFLNFTV